MPFGLLTAVLRRSRSDWPVLFAAWVLLAGAIALLTAGALYSDAVTVAGLRRELRDARPAERSVVVATRILPERVADADAAIGPALDAILAPTGGERSLVLWSLPFADAAMDPGQVSELVRFASLAGIERHAVLVEGAWAQPDRSPVEATLSTAGAAALGVGVGDRLSLVTRMGAERMVEVRVVGTWTADPADAFWQGDPLLLQGRATSGSFTGVGPLVVAGVDLLGGRLSSPVDAAWRAIPSIEGFRPEVLDPLMSAVDGLAGRINAALPESNQASVATRLPEIVGGVDRSVLVSQAGILLLLVQFGVLAGYAVVLVAALLVDRRAAGTALLRARGAGVGHLVRMALLEGLLLVAPAIVAAPWIASLLIVLVARNPALAGIGLEPLAPGPIAFGVAAGTGGLALAALVLPTLAGAGTAGVRTALGRQIGRTLPQRLGLDLALVLLGAIALLQLRQYGAPLTASSRGSLGVDPLLVAAPAIGLLGGAVLAIRIIPRLAEVAERVLAGSRGLVASLVGRQIARRPLRYTRAALLLILAAALGTFAGAHAATWAQSQADQASYASGADLRLEPGPGSNVPGWALGSVLRAIPGVEAATPIVRATVDLGAPLRDGTLLALDPGAMAGIVRLRADASGAATVAALADLGTRQTGPAGVPIPTGTSVVRLTLSSEFLPQDGFAPIPDGHPGLTASVVVLDADGRAARLSSLPGPMGQKDVSLEIPLTTADGGALAMPAELLAIEVGASVTGLGNALGIGAIEVDGLEASTGGGAWTTVDLAAAPRAWTVSMGGGAEPVMTTSAAPDRLPVDGLYGGVREFWQRSLLGDAPDVLPILVNPAFLARSGAVIGDEIHAIVYGIPFRLTITGSVEAFPPMGPATPFVLTGARSLALARFAAGASLVETDEWWLSTRPGVAPGPIVTALAADPVGAAGIVDRAGLLADLSGDPLGLGVIGILGLGSIASLLFAAIGFLLTSTVSTSERLGEFALLKALGLSPRQLLAWLAVENVALLVVGIGAGIGLGMVLAWMALPFATMTAAGSPPVPSPVVVIPVDALLPILAMAAILVVISSIIVRGQLPAARTGAVLRAGDE